VQGEGKMTFFSREKKKGEAAKLEKAPTCLNAEKELMISMIGREREFSERENSPGGREKKHNLKKRAEGELGGILEKRLA